MKFSFWNYFYAYLVPILRMRSLNKTMAYSKNLLFNFWNLDYYPRALFNKQVLIDVNDLYSISSLNPIISKIFVCHYN